MNKAKKFMNQWYMVIIALFMGLAIGIFIGSSFKTGSLEDDGWVRYDEVFGEITKDIERCFMPENVDGFDTFLGLRTQIDVMFEDYAQCTYERVDISRELTTCFSDLTDAEHDAEMYLSTYSDIQYDAVNAENKLLFCKDNVDRLESMLNPPEGGYCYLRTWPDECSPLCAPGSCPP